MSGFYYTDFKRFAKNFDLKVKANKSDVVLMYMMEHLGEWVVSEVKEKTPVGVYPAYRYVNFVTNYGKKVSFIARDGRVGGTLRRGWKKTKVTKFGNSFRIIIYNNVHYAPSVEMGHNKVNRHGQIVGWQPGQFMLELTIEEAKKYIIPVLGDMYYKLLKQFMEG